MGAKKTGITDIENGKELFISLSKLEAVKEGAKNSKEKVRMDLLLDRETKITVCDSNMQDLYSTVVEGQDIEGYNLRIVIANTIVGNGYYIKAISTDGELKKQVYIEPNR